MQAASLIRRAVAPFAASGAASAMQIRRACFAHGLERSCAAARVFGAGRGSPFAASGGSRWMSGKKDQEKKHRSEGNKNTDKTSMLLKELGMTKDDIKVIPKERAGAGKGSGAGGRGAALKKAPAKKDGPILTRGEMLRNELLKMSSQRRASAVQRLSPKPPHGWAFVDMSARYWEELEQTIQSQNVIMLEQKFGDETVTIVTSLNALHRMDDEKDLGLDGESELEARDFESDMNMKSMEEDYGPTYNLSAVVLICISKPTQRHPLVVVCAVAEAVGFYIERAIIGPASTNDLGVLESQPLGWVYDKHRRESINADVPEVPKADGEQTSTQCCFEGIIRDHSPLNNYMEDIFKARTLSKENVIQYLLEYLYQAEVDKEQKFFDSAADFFDKPHDQAPGHVAAKV